MNQKETLNENEIKAIMTAFVSDLNKPAKSAKGCRWVEYCDPKTSMMVGEYQ